MVSFQGKRKARVFQGLSGFPGFVGHPVFVDLSDSEFHINFVLI